MSPAEYKMSQATWLHRSLPDFTFSRLFTRDYFKHCCAPHILHVAWVGEQEMLSVVHALEVGHCHLDGQDFRVITDDSPNVLCANMKVVRSPAKGWN